MTSNSKDRPWLFRTYAGHSTAAASNRLYRDNLSKGQTGLSVAFDLPTQTGYDSDHVLARGEVGKVGVPICHLGDMRALFDQIPLETMNTSMTINATAPWLLALYIETAREQGATISNLTGTVQNDILKEYLSRGTYIFPPSPSLKLTSDVITHCLVEMPKWNPINICSYHLQEAGATPEQELAFALGAATAVLDDVRARVSPRGFPAGCRQAVVLRQCGCPVCHGTVQDARLRRSLGRDLPRTLRRGGPAISPLQVWRAGQFPGPDGAAPENNVYRILLEMLAVTLFEESPGEGVQLPA